MITVHWRLTPRARMVEIDGEDQETPVVSREEHELSLAALSGQGVPTLHKFHLAGVGECLAEVACVEVSVRSDGPSEMGRVTQELFAVRRTVAFAGHACKVTAENSRSQA